MSGCQRLQHEGLFASTLHHKHRADETREVLHLAGKPLSLLHQTHAFLSATISIGML